MKLPLSFYMRDNVVEIAKDLIGKTLFTRIEGHITGGIILETEAYAGIHDKASHAYNGRRTSRTRIMYMRGGTAYVYLCYGMHDLFNVVTGEPDVPDAVLIRGIKAVHGIDIIRQRSGKEVLSGDSINGPGRVTKALGIRVAFSGIDLMGDLIWLEDNQFIFDHSALKVTARIGVGYAGEDALLPYRFLL